MGRRSALRAASSSQGEGGLRRTRLAGCEGTTRADPVTGETAAWAVYPWPHLIGDWAGRRENGRTDKNQRDAAQGLYAKRWPDSSGISPPLRRHQAKFRQVTGKATGANVIREPGIVADLYCGSLLPHFAVAQRNHRPRRRNSQALLECSGYLASATRAAARSPRTPITLIAALAAGRAHVAGLTATPERQRGMGMVDGGGGQNSREWRRVCVGWVEGKTCT
jgi:hypothetical protein